MAAVGRRESALEREVQADMARQRTIPRNHRRRGGSERGASLVEFALVAPVLFLVVFGIVEFGMGLNDYQSLRQGVREGARQAAVQQYGAEDGTCTTITAPTPVKQVICLAEDRIGLGNDVRTSVRYWLPAPSTDPDQTQANPDYGTVVVCSQKAVQPLTGAIPGLENIKLKTEIEMRLEDTLDTTVATPVNASVGRTKTWSEDAPTGGNWSWC